MAWALYTDVHAYEKRQAKLSTCTLVTLYVYVKTDENTRCIAPKLQKMRVEPTRRHRRPAAPAWLLSSPADAASVLALRPQAALAATALARLQDNRVLVKRTNPNGGDESNSELKQTGEYTKEWLIKPRMNQCYENVIETRKTIHTNTHKWVKN